MLEGINLFFLFLAHCHIVTFRDCASVSFDLFISYSQYEAIASALDQSAVNLGHKRCHVLPL